MKYHKRITTLTLASVLAVTAVFTMPAAAVQQSGEGSGQGLEISPPVLTLRADPGQTVQARISLRDVSPTSQRVTNEINDFVAEGEDGTPRVLLEADAEDSPYSLKDWIAPLPTFTLKPREIENLSLTVRVPQNAAPGGYYAVIRFTGRPPNLDGTGVSLSTSIGTLVLLTVKGDATEGMALEEFSATQGGTPGSLFESTPVTFLTRVKNTGNVHQQPSGQIKIQDSFGQDVAAINVNLQGNNVLPRSIRKFEQPLDSSVIGNRMLFGRYTATLTMKYGSDDQTLTSTISFWVIPYRLIILAIAALIVAFIIIRLAMKRYNERIIQKAQRSRRRRR